MSYKILKAQYNGHNSKTFTAQIFDENNNVIKEIKSIGRKAVKKQAESYIKNNK